MSSKNKDECAIGANTYIIEGIDADPYLQNLVSILNSKVLTIIADTNTRDQSYALVFTALSLLNDIKELKASQSNSQNDPQVSTPSPTNSIALNSTLQDSTASISNSTASLSTPIADVQISNSSSSPEITPSPESEHNSLITKDNTEQSNQLDLFSSNTKQDSSSITPQAEPPTSNNVSNKHQNDLIYTADEINNLVSQITNSFADKIHFWKTDLIQNILSITSRDNNITSSNASIATGKKK